ncbi:MAG: hypothetical protein WB783_20260 [Arenicellales bacterium]
MRLIEVSDAAEDYRGFRQFSKGGGDHIAALGGDRIVWDFATYCQEIVDGYFEGHRFRDIPAEKYYGIQCFALCADAALSFAEFVGFSQRRGLRGFADVLVAHWLKEAYGIDKIPCAIPSLAQHKGTESNHGHAYFVVPGFADDLEDLVGDTDVLVRTNLYRVEIARSDGGFVQWEDGGAMKISLRELETLDLCDVSGGSAISQTRSRTLIPKKGMTSSVAFEMRVRQLRCRGYRYQLTHNQHPC